MPTYAYTVYVKHVGILWFVSIAFAVITYRMNGSLILILIQFNAHLGKYLLYIIPVYDQQLY
jgi:hypothetical protein